MKIVWICHFTNVEIQEQLPLWKATREFTPWIPNYIKGFENRNDIELHVISPHQYLKRETFFMMRGVRYYFFPVGMPVIRRHWPSFFRFDLLTKFHAFNKNVKKTLISIQPSVVNLFGAENAYYSSSVIKIRHKYPFLITIQGFISEWKEMKKQSPELRYRIKVEEEILQKFQFFSGEQDSSTYISKYNPNHVFFKQYLPVNEALVEKTQETEKNFDCIFFGKLVKDKGIEDFIQIISELKRFIPAIRACIVGGGDDMPYRTLAKQLHCYENLTFFGFVKTQKEVFEYVKASRVFLIPTYKERLASAIRESMFLKVPVVAYSTGGIPYINEHDEYIYLVETGNHKRMAQRTLALLQDDTLREQLANKGYRFAWEEFSLKKNSERLTDAYLSILNHQ